ncbi:YidB family protein [Kitasatospora sp. NBC_01287]|uniref:YidB family protein n=1 Tax=Kitasatospora sp. NBC_01287 TaxID=2903573 RepID=UPI002253CEBE|nr:YidB family protein [Kitasatospora sp. NBC_01287]MCX4751193.1 YidB family protein [Kitasatospora sp. NBC_01287]
MSEQASRNSIDALSPSREIDGISLSMVTEGALKESTRMLQEMHRLDLPGIRSANVQSWVGTEANEPLTSSEVITILGQDTLAEVAEKTGADTGELADYVAEQLPVLIDQISPDGQITSDPEVFNQAFTEFENNAPFAVPTARIGMAAVRPAEFIILQFTQEVGQG